MSDDLERQRREESVREAEQERRREAYAEEQRRLRERDAVTKSLLGDDKKSEPPDDSDRE